MNRSQLECKTVTVEDLALSGVCLLEAGMKVLGRKGILLHKAVFNELSEFRGLLRGWRK